MMIGVADALSDGTADGGLLDGIHEQSIADENVEHKRSAVSIPVCVRARARACASVSTHTPVRRYGGTRVVRHCTARIASVAHRQSRTLFVACSLRSMTSWPVCQVTCVVHRMLHVPRSMLRYLGCASVGFRRTSAPSRRRSCPTATRTRLPAVPPQGVSAKQSPAVAHR
jgi:hypothetical protein